MDQTHFALAVHVRWLIRHDMPEVLEILKSCPPPTWAEEDVLIHQRTTNRIGMVAEAGEKGKMGESRKALEVLVPETNLVPSFSSGPRDSAARRFRAGNSIKRTVI
jgi:hypothetical protein